MGCAINGKCTLCVCVCAHAQVITVCLSLQNQRREMETEDQSTRNTYWELEPYYDHCSVLDGVAADTKVGREHTHNVVQLEMFPVCIL